MADLPPHLAAQLDAAARENDSLFESYIVPTFKDLLPHRTNNPGDIADLMIGALARRLKHQCGHLASPVPCIADLSLGDLNCYRCMESRPPPPFVDDGRCDVCDAAATRFIPVIVSFGPVTVMANACTDCMALITPDRPQEPTC